MEKIKTFKTSVGVLGGLASPEISEGIVQRRSKMLVFAVLDSLLLLNRSFTFRS